MRELHPGLKDSDHAPDRPDSSPAPLDLGGEGVDRGLDRATWVRMARTSGWVARIRVRVASQEDDSTSKPCHLGSRSEMLAEYRIPPSRSRKVKRTPPPPPVPTPPR